MKSGFPIYFETHIQESMVLSSGVCLAAAMRVMEWAPNLFTKITNCRIQGVSERAVAICIASFLLWLLILPAELSNTSFPLHFLGSLCSRDKGGDLSDGLWVSQLLGAEPGQNKAVLDTHCMQPSEGGSKY